MKSLLRRIGVKKTLTRFGEISIVKSHSYMRGSHQGFDISPRMQDLMVYASHMGCYHKCGGILGRFLSIGVSPAQVYRVTNSVPGSLVGEEAKVERILPPIEKTGVLYAGLDGSMVCTREDGWKEVKLARLFKGSDCLNPNSTSSYLPHSQYVAFLETAMLLVKSYNRRYPDMGS